MRKSFLLWIGILFVYLLFAGRGKFQFHTTQRNFFSLQAYSWLRGRLDLAVLPNDITDLSFYQGKAYIYWPPLPTLFAFPFVLLFGINTSDVFYTAFWAATPPILLYLVLNKARKVNLIPQISDKSVLLLTLFFAFGTVFFYLSVVGSVWFTSQIISMIPLLLSLFFLFKFVETKKPTDYFLSLMALCLAFWARNSTFILFLIHLYILFQTDKIMRKKIIVIAISILIINFLFFGLFNYIRFGNVFETGQGLHLANPRWTEDLKNYGLLSFHYWQHNFYYLFINPVNFDPQTYFVLPDPEGNSIFSTSPLFLLIFSCLSIEYIKKKNRIVLIYLFTSVLSFLFLLSYFATGWFQFGSRYALDVIPLLILSLTFVIGKFPKSVVVGLFLLSVAINVMGAIWMLQLAPYLNY